MPLNAAVFCSQGLGDSLLFFIVANNLKKNGFQVTAYHDFLEEMKTFFPFEIKPYPQIEELEKIVADLDLVIINSDSSDRCQWLISLIKKLKPKQHWILHATTCKGKNLPGNYYLDPTYSMVKNLTSFCADGLKLKNSSQENGLNLNNSRLAFRRNLKRLVFHPSSKDEHKNWPLRKFLHLASSLKHRGYEISFILSRMERPFYYQKIEKAGFAAPEFKSLPEMAAFLYESGFFVGNDSGIGHLASNLEIPTLIIFSTKRKENFWHPDWAANKTVTPYTLLPNIKHLRLQEKYWKVLLPVFKVFRKFIELERESI